MKIQCAFCGKEIDRKPSEIKRSKTGNVYCNKSCSNSKNNTLFKSDKNHQNYKTGISSYRKKAFKTGDKCEECKIDELYVLEVHHIDGNRKNNKKDNLKILCANCHKRAHFKNRVVG